ncbi:hypothetical protein, partial [Micrococcus luteus]|uniref:hypothetical protein n=1 Tax=Micrococcus luteus TaxID=1270 RepID=UPI003317BAAB
MTTAAVLPLRHPKGPVRVPGSPGWRYQIDPAAIFSPNREEEESEGKGRPPALSWCPMVSERLVTLREDGSTGATYYRMTCGDEPVTASHEEVTTHKVWHRVAMPGTGTRTVRDV